MIQILLEWPRDMKIEGTTLDVYGVWLGYFPFQLFKFLQGLICYIGLEMAWRKMTAFRFAKFGRLSWIDALKLVNRLQYFFAVILSPAGRKSNLPRSHQTHSNIFIGCKPALGTGSVHSPTFCSSIWVEGYHKWFIFCRLWKFSPRRKKSRVTVQHNKINF